MIRSIPLPEKIRSNLRKNYDKFQKCGNFIKSSVNLQINGFPRIFMKSMKFFCVYIDECWQKLKITINHRRLFLNMLEMTSEWYHNNFVQKMKSAESPICMN